MIDLNKYKEFVKGVTSKESQQLSEMRIASTTQLMGNVLCNQRP